MITPVAVSEELSGSSSPPLPGRAVEAARLLFPARRWKQLATPFRQGGATSFRQGGGSSSPPLSGKAASRGTRASGRGINPGRLPVRILLWTSPTRQHLFGNRQEPTRHFGTYSPLWLRLWGFLRGGQLGAPCYGGSYSPLGLFDSKKTKNPKVLF